MQHQINYMIHWAPGKEDTGEMSVMQIDVPLITAKEFNRITGTENYFLFKMSLLIQCTP